MKRVGLAVAFIALTIALSFMVVKVNKQPKIAVVDNAKVLALFGEAIEVREFVEAEQKRVSDQEKQLVDSLNFYLSKLESEKISEIDRKELIQKINHWNSKIAKFRSTSIQQLSNLQSEKALPVIDKMYAFIEDWGKENGFDLVIGVGTNGGVLLMRNDALDVTNKVITDLNAFYGHKSSDKPKQLAKVE